MNVKPRRSRIPLVSIVLMSIFVIGGSVALLLDWPPGPANLDWGVWTVAYFGYLYIIAAAVFYVIKER